MMQLDALQPKYRRALALGYERLRARDPAALQALGALDIEAAACRLPVLNSVFSVDWEKETCTLADGGAIGVEWQIAALHYLGAPVPWRKSTRWVSFAELEPAARVYDSVFRARVIGRLCGTVGRERKSFVEACTKLGGARAEWGDEGFRFDLFPQLSVIIAWFSGGDEFSPGASVVYPEHATDLLSSEDIVVVSERLVSRLQGKKW